MTFVYEVMGGPDNGRRVEIAPVRSRSSLEYGRKTSSDQASWDATYGVDVRPCIVRPYAGIEPDLHPDTLVLAMKELTLLSQGHTVEGHTYQDSRPADEPPVRAPFQTLTAQPTVDPEPRVVPRSTVPVVGKPDADDNEPYAKELMEYYRIMMGGEYDEGSGYERGSVTPAPVKKVMPQAELPADAKPRKAETFVPPPTRTHADKVKLTYCPACGSAALERFEAARRCTSCDRAFYIVHTSSSTATEPEDGYGEETEDAQSESEG